MYPKYGWSAVHNSPDSLLLQLCFSGISSIFAVEQWHSTGSIVLCVVSLT